MGIIKEDDIREGWTPADKIKDWCGWVLGRDGNSGSYPRQAAKDGHRLAEGGVGSPAQADRARIEHRK